jgi:alpha-aminoadipic semialdehyde synthase
MSSPIVGIRREGKSRWERRSPLAPVHVKALVERGIKVLVQPSTIRVYHDSKYQEAGAIISEDLSSCGLILGVKEVPGDQLIPEKTYMFFSHTIKAQPYNMPMLDLILSRKIRLIDYEKITDDSGARTIFFGRYAGLAGATDLLHALGDRLLALGSSTPFLHLGYSYMYSSLNAAKEAVESVGEEIASVGLPPNFSPLLFGFISNGNSSRGAQEIINMLPHTWIKPSEVDALMAEAKKNPTDKKFTHQVFATIIEGDDYMVAKEDSSMKGKPFDKKHYYTHPSEYRSIFHEKFAPHLSVIMNCRYWDERFDRMITNQQMKTLVETGTSRLIAVADISCDPQGSLEFLAKTTSIDAPLFVYDPKSREIYEPSSDKDYMYRPGIVMLAVDNLPTELPKEATTYFGDKLVGHVEAIAKSRTLAPYEEMAKELPKDIYRAVVTANGALTPPFAYIAELRKQTTAHLKKILVLGAGFVARPCLQYLARTPSHTITVADVTEEIARAAISDQIDSTRRSEGNATMVAVALDVTNAEALSSLVSQHDLVISLLPRQFNVNVALACIEHKKSMVNSSYVAPELRALEEQIKAAGIIILNECGLDPGIDHMSTLDLIDKIRLRDGKIKSFISWCGALPAPETGLNPFKYTFSWSPKGVLMASIADAKYRLLGQEVNIKGHELFKHKQAINLFPGLHLEGVPNRNSLVYATEYNIEEAETVFRGTLRYHGFAEAIEALVDLGLVDDNTKLSYLAPDAPEITWPAFLKRFFEARLAGSATNGGKGGHLDARQLARLQLRPPVGFPQKGYDGDKVNRVLEALAWLGIFNESEKVVRKHTPMEALTALMTAKLSFDPKTDWDAVYMHHVIEATFPDGSEERHDMTFSAYGKRGGVTAISATVGKTVAIASELVLYGNLPYTGILTPMKPEIFKPAMQLLQDEGFRFIHRVTKQEPISRED